MKRILLTIAALSTLTLIGCQPQNSAVKQQLNQLDQELTAQEFGKIEILLAHGANQYTPGAIQTTYDILMLPNGHHADLNGDGRINSPEELDRLPCQTLIDIEKLWRKHTNDRCGWIQPDSSSLSPRCSELELVSTYEMIDPQTRQDITKTISHNLTLLATIFNPMDFDFLEPKLNRCLAKIN